MLKHISKILIIVLILLLSTSVIYFSFNWLTGNFHTITVGQAYRSRQLDKKNFEYYILKYNIKSILNLRGDEPNVKWYEDEIDISKEYNIMHYDLEIPSLKEPIDKDIEEIIRILKSAPRPILIHCMGGADRSGLVAAVWKIVIEKEPKLEADNQLSILYGHMPFGKARAMDRWLASHHIDTDSGKITKLK